MTVIKSLFSILFVLLIVSPSVSQRCLDNNGIVVSWWVMLNTPKTTPDIEYFYLDSTFNTSIFQLFNTSPSENTSALGRTLTQVNTLGLQTVAWNDAKPNGSTSSSSAHSKIVVAIDTLTDYGFILDHSMPKYPNFINGTLNITIDASQSIYGQHAFCISLPGSTIDTIVGNQRIIRPYVYYSNVLVTSSYNNLYSIGNSVYLTTSSNFQYFDFIQDGFEFKSIYKNGNTSRNCSMFEDGLNNYLNSSLFVQTWGRPLDAAWCGTPQVNNVQTVGINATVNWTQTKDHSKWAIVQNGTFSCYGDMNRMASQWKRGGSFYCVNSSLLHDAMLSLITTDSC